MELLSVMYELICLIGMPFLVFCVLHAKDESRKQ